MRVAIVGATGFVGRHLVSHLARAGGYHITVVSRHAAHAACPDAQEFVQWDPQSARLVPFLSQDAIINLAGEPVAPKRWTTRRKHAILDSRIRTTQRLVAAMQTAHARPSVLINASAVGYYGARETVAVEETPGGDDFLAQVCHQWEQAALLAQGCEVRTVVTRFGLILGPDGGPLAQMLPTFRRGLGGKLGSGRQWMSWIHITDVVRALAHCLRTPSLHGPVNIVAPNPVRNEDFVQTLGNAVTRPACLPAPAFALRLLLGEMADMLLTGQQVAPEQLRQSGFAFQFPDLKPALQSILQPPTQPQDR